jgi:UDP-N-acetyl-D-glucosamine dehydrogenase
MNRTTPGPGIDFHATCSLSTSKLRGLSVNAFQHDHAVGQAAAALPPSADLLVIGLGYVGLPLAREAVFSGLTVVGYDLNAALVAALNAGRSHVGDVPAADIAEMLGKGFRATSRAEEAGNPGTVVICVPTPLSADGAPDLSAVRGAAKMTGRLLRPGMLVVLESTTYPGTTDEVVRPLLEKASGLTAGVDFSLAFSPERIDPGNPHYSVRNTPKVVGGQTSSCAEAAERFYGLLCDQVVRARSAREAEMAKLLENTYRHVNIALVNEMAIFCRELGVDLRDAIRCAATKPFGFQAFHPGPGVGGHCIPIDPVYLSYRVRALGYPFRFAELAQEINSRMPVYTADRAAEVLNSHGKPLKGARVLLLGVTYKADVADQRESPVRMVGRRLRSRGAILTYHDPYVREWRLDEEPVRRATDLDAEVENADLVILLQDHSRYDLDRISRLARLILDTRGRMEGPDVELLLPGHAEGPSCRLRCQEPECPDGRP